MLGKVKLWIAGFFSLLSAGLFALLKIKESELEVAEEKIKASETKDKINEAKKKADDETLKDFWEDKKAVEDEYDSKFKQANTHTSSNPLSPESLRLLQGRSDNKGTDAPSS